LPLLLLSAQALLPFAGACRERGKDALVPFLLIAPFAPVALARDLVTVVARSLLVLLLFPLQLPPSTTSARRAGMDPDLGRLPALVAIGRVAPIVAARQPVLPLLLPSPRAPPITTERSTAMNLVLALVRPPVLLQMIAGKPIITTRRRPLLPQEWELDLPVLLPQSIAGGETALGMDPALALDLLRAPPRATGKEAVIVDATSLLELASEPPPPTADLGLAPAN